MANNTKGQAVIEVGGGKNGLIESDIMSKAAASSGRGSSDDRASSIGG